MRTTTRQLDSEPVQDSKALLFSIAYRMLGSVADAEDVVQEAALRFHRATENGDAIESPRAWLSAVTTRLSIDRLRSAQARRETYVGTWLPEPLVEEVSASPEHAVATGENVSMAFLVVLESLTPAERAVFLLRQVFDYEYGEIATIVGKTEENCRQIHARARRHVETRRPRFEAAPAVHDEIVKRFAEACRTGDLTGLEQLLAEDARVYGDGGGKAAAVGSPFEGRQRIAHFFLALFRKGRDHGLSLQLVHVNGESGLMVRDGDGRTVSVMAIEIVDGVITSIRSVVNPDKLQHLGPVSDLARFRTR